MSQVLTACCCRPQDPCVGCCAPASVLLTWPSFTAAPFSMGYAGCVETPVTVPSGSGVARICCFQNPTLQTARYLMNPVLLPCIVPVCWYEEDTRQYKMTNLTGIVAVAWLRFEASRPCRYRVEFHYTAHGCWRLGQAPLSGGALASLVWASPQPRLWDCEESTEFGFPNPEVHACPSRGGSPFFSTEGDGFPGQYKRQDDLGHETTNASVCNPLGRYSRVANVGLRYIDVT